MSCYHPNLRIEYNKIKINKQGQPYFACSIFGDKDPVTGNSLYDLYKTAIGNPWYGDPSGIYKITRVDLTKCTRCIGCRLDYSKEWATRGYLESLYHENNWFVTLTYDQAHLPMMLLHLNCITGEVWENNGEWNGVLVPDDMRKFINSLRKWLERNRDKHGMRYMWAGEYGDELGRPHYHGIFFDLPINNDDLIPWGINKEHQPLYRSKLLESLWGKGYVVIGKVTWSSIAYTARYMLKKINGDMKEEYYASKGQRQEMFRMSTKPGIGFQYFQDHHTDIYQLDEIIMKTCRDNVASLKPPRYYDNLYDVLYPEDMERIKNKRKLLAEEAEKVRMSKTTLNRLEQLEVQERTQVQKAKRLKRTIE